MMAGRVLIVEDDRIIRELMTEFLAEQGYGTYATDDIGDAVTASAALQPQVILLDATLAKSGTTGARILREQSPGVGIIAVSAYSDFGGDSVVAYVDETLAKPFDLDDLLATVRRYCLLPNTA
jgi:DNA-binding response OmpR family regulator